MSSETSNEDFDRKNKLDLIEKELIKRSSELDEKIANLAAREKSLKERVGAVTSKEVYDSIHKHVDSIFTVVAAHGMDPDRGMEAVQLVWDSRKMIMESIEVPEIEEIDSTET